MKSWYSRERVQYVTKQPIYDYPNTIILFIILGVVACLKNELDECTPYEAASLKLDYILYIIIHNAITYYFVILCL